MGVATPTSRGARGCSAGAASTSRARVALARALLLADDARAGCAEAHRRLQFRNRLLMIAKNERRRDAACATCRGSLGYEVLALGHVLLRERELLRGYGEFRRLLPGARRAGGSSSRGGRGGGACRSGCGRRRELLGGGAGVGDAEPARAAVERGLEMLRMMALKLSPPTGWNM